MKQFIIIFLALFVPQSIFAGDDFSFFGSMENRGAILGDNKIPIAENKAAKAGETGTPVELDFNGTHVFKIGAGVKWRGFDLGFYYTDMDSSNNSKDKFKDTFPLSTGPKGFAVNPLKPTELGKQYLIDPATYGTATTKGSVDSKFSFNHYDVELGAMFKADKITFRVSAGARYAEYDQSLSVKRDNSWECVSNPASGSTTAVPLPDIKTCADPDLMEDPDPTVPGGETYNNPKFSNIRNLDMDITAFGPRLGFSVAAAYTKNISLVGAVNFAVLFSDWDFVITKDRAPVFHAPKKMKNRLPQKYFVEQIMLKK